MVVVVVDTVVVVLLTVVVGDGGGGSGCGGGRNGRDGVAGHEYSKMVLVAVSVVLFGMVLME